MYDINWTLKEIKWFTTCYCHHLNDCLDYQKMNIPNVKFAYVGHCAEKTIFKTITKIYNMTYLLLVVSPLST